MKILILHALTDRSLVRRTSFNHAFALIKYAPEHDYTLHCFGQPITSRLRSASFDAIVLDTTFLCLRWAKPRSDCLDRILEDYDFIAKSSAVKVALPQDEYDHSEYLDEWLSAWRIDLIYSVCFEHRNIFYPRASVGAEIVEGLTGYIDDADLEFMSRFSLPFDQRDVDVGYRARSLPAFFGKFGRLKAEIGEKFKLRMSNCNLRLDISTNAQDTLSGDEWLKFLGRSRFTLGCESGSSLLDPRGEIRSCVEAELEERGVMSFELLEQSCFPGQDMRHLYSATSPRLFEAAIAGSCQILVPGHYLGALRKDEHYIPLEEDLSNAEEVLEKIRDTKSNLARIQASYAALVDTPKFRYKTFVSAMLSRIIRIGENKCVARGLPLAEQVDAPTGEPALRHSFAMIIFENNIQHLEEMQELQQAGEARLVSLRNEITLRSVFVRQVRRIVGRVLRSVGLMK